jgi:tRNA pseudouridine13 synthase
MKLKSIPEDFVVHERSDFTPDPAGRLFVYQLEKRSLATMEALAIIARANGVRTRDLSAAGLKDKHGLTRQLFSSTKPLRLEDDPRIRLDAVGKCAQPLTAACITGNEFVITLRNLNEPEPARMQANAAEITAAGIPNYYDNQRFGGIAHKQGFIGKALARGDFEEACRLHLAAPHRKQSLKDKQNRRMAAEMWGDWETLHRRMRKSPERALVQFLRDNADDPLRWAKCFDRIPPTLRNLFVAAYQSYLYNETLAAFIREHAGEYAELRNRAGLMAFHREPLDAAPELPLPGAGTRLEDWPESRAYLETVLDREGVSLDDLRLEGLDRTRFKASSRNALVFPEGLELGAPEDDDLNPGRLKLTTRFALPRGCFATIITRRLGLDWESAKERSRAAAGE